jgi:hypothetical protein
MTEGLFALISGRELARRLDVCDRTLARWRALGMPSQLAGRQYRYAPDAVLLWIQARAAERMARRAAGGAS